MSERRAVINSDKAINALPEKPLITTFLYTPEGRLYAMHPKESIINMLEVLGGADVTGPNALSESFGLSIPWKKNGQVFLLFIETRQDFCPFCQGAKKVRNEVDMEIISEVCWVCNGIGKVLTKPVPVKPAPLA